MKRTKKTARAVLCLTFIAACGGLEEIAQQESDVTYAPLGVTEIVVALRDSSSCEVPMGSEWSLVPNGQNALDIFCVYAWGSSAEPDYGELELIAGPYFSRNLPLVMPLAGDTQVNGAITNTGSRPLSELLRPALFDAYRRRLSVPPVLPVKSNTPAVEVALVDTTPENAPAPRSVHAPTLQALIEDVVCERGKKCAARVTKYLALPRIRNLFVDRTNGGYYGTLWDLASAVVAAVDGADSSSSLIVNLSVGWEHNQLAPNLPANHVDAQVNPTAHGVDFSILAVHRALLYARCKGALVIAAAGNDPLVRRSGGVMYPGGFTTLRAPNANECASLFNVPNAPVQAGTALLVAVGGVDHRDLPIANAIPEAIPELVAPAADVTPSRSGAVLTGTSVAAASATAVAALAWSVWRTASADDVHDVMRQSAVPLSLVSTLHASGSGAPGDSSIRLSACDAAALACIRSSTQCRPAACTPPPRAESDGRPSRRVVYAALSKLAGPYLPLGSLYENATINAGPLCGLVRKLKTGWTWGCPLDSAAAAHNLPVGPQPLDPICPACTVVHDPNEVLINMSVVETIPNGQVENPMLYIEDANGAETIPLPAPIPQGFSGKVSLGPTSVQGPLLKAILHYEYTQNNQTYSSGEPLMVAQ